MAFGGVLVPTGTLRGTIVTYLLISLNLFGHE
jgi:hypothetical protein